MKSCGSEELLDSMAKYLEREFGRCHFLVRGKEETAKGFQLVPLYASTKEVHDTFPQSLGEGDCVRLDLKHHEPRRVDDLRDPNKTLELKSIPPDEPWHRIRYSVSTGRFEVRSCFSQTCRMPFRTPTWLSSKSAPRMAQFGLPRFRRWIGPSWERICFDVRPVSRWRF